MRDVPMKGIMEHRPSSLTLILDLYGKNSFLCCVLPTMLHLVPRIKDLRSSNQDNKPFFPVSCLVQVSSQTDRKLANTTLSMAINWWLCEWR